MGNRLTQIATRTGDDGTTGLGDNTRVSKNSARPHAMGDVDELNSHIGLLLCEALPEDVRAVLVDVQHQLFNLGGEISVPGYEMLKEVSDRTGIPVAYTTGKRDLLEQFLSEGHGRRPAAPGRSPGPLQRTAATSAGIHPARRHPRCLAGPYLPHRGTPRRAQRGRPAGV